MRASLSLEVAIDPSYRLGAATLAGSLAEAFIDRLVRAVMAYGR
jgi:hypothetical protein